MKNLELNLAEYGVEEMGRQELVRVEGGKNIFKTIGDAVKTAVEAVGDAAEASWKWCKEHVGPYVENGSVGVKIHN